MTISVLQSDIDASSPGITTNSLAQALNRLYPLFGALAIVDITLAPFFARCTVEGNQYSINNLAAITAVALQNSANITPSAPYNAEITPITL